MREDNNNNVINIIHKQCNIPRLSDVTRDHHCSLQTAPRQSSPACHLCVGMCVKVRNSVFERTLSRMALHARRLSRRQCAHVKRGIPECCRRMRFASAASLSSTAFASASASLFCKSCGEVCNTD